MQNCKLCRFWEESKKEENMGECRAVPPKVFPMPGKLGGLGTVSVFPMTQPTSWCGSFSASEIEREVD